MHVQVPFLDLKIQFENHREEIEQAIQAVLRAGAYLEGPEVASFERSFAQFCGTSEAVAVDSGTAALQLALLAVGVQPQEEVILPTNTFIATAAAVSAVGANPVFVDSDPATWLIDLDLMKEKIGPRTKAIVPVHLYGNPVDMDTLNRIAQEHGIQVIEDACQAHGATLQGRRVGSLGRIACFSFYPSKNLGAFGDGGIVTTKDSELAERIRRLRNHGRTGKYEHAEAAFNLRMDTLQASILQAKLRHLENWNRQRQEHAAQYRSRLAHLPLETPKLVKGSESVYHLFPVCHARRDEIAESLKARFVATGVHYPIPCHLQPAYRELGHKKGDFPVSEKIASQVLTLPMFPEMAQEQIDHVCRSLEEIFALAAAAH